MRYLSLILLVSCSIAGMKTSDGVVDGSSLENDPNGNGTNGNGTNGNGTNGNGTNGEDPDETPWENDPIFEDADIPSVLGELDDSFCDEMSEELGVPGATSYFVGTYIKQNNSWVGREKWILFPNEHWQEYGGYPCEISWDMSIEERDLVTCLACDIAMEVDASISSSSTNCPQDLWNEPSEQNWSTTYEIMLDNGSSTFYFQSSGNPFGWGYSSQTSINFVSEPDCKWF